MEKYFKATIGFAPNHS